MKNKQIVLKATDTISSYPHRHLETYILGASSRYFPSPVSILNQASSGETFDEAEANVEELVF